MGGSSTSSQNRGGGWGYKGKADCSHSSKVPSCAKSPLLSVNFQRFLGSDTGVLGGRAVALAMERLHKEPQNPPFTKTHPSGHKGLQDGGERP